MRENLSGGLRTAEGADQPVHPRSLVSTFVICLLESDHIKTSSKQNFTILTSLCSLGDWFETGLSFALSETLKTGSSR